MSHPTKPCDNCPFTYDGIRVQQERMEEFDEAMRQDVHFLCHKTCTHDDEGEPSTSGKEALCAGYEILNLREYGRISQMARISSRFGFFDAEALMAHEESDECRVFSSMSEALDAHDG